MLVLDMFLIPHRLGIDDPDPNRDPSVRGDDEEEDAGVEHIFVEPEVVIFRRRSKEAAVVEVVFAIAEGRSNVRASPIFRLAMLAFNVFANQTVVIPRVWFAVELIFLRNGLRARLKGGAYVQSE
jgi:hypothetical protein